MASGRLSYKCRKRWRFRPTQKEPRGGRAPIQDSNRVVGLGKQPAPLKILTEKCWRRPSTTRSVDDATPLLSSTNFINEGRKLAQVTSRAFFSSFLSTLFIFSFFVSVFFVCVCVCVLSRVGNRYHFRRASSIKDEDDKTDETRETANEEVETTNDDYD